MKKLFMYALFVLVLPFSIFLTGCFGSDEQYDITITQVDNIQIYCEVSEANKGEEITLYYENIEIGYKFSYFTLNGEKLDNNTFTMPSKNVNISAVVSKIQYTITYHIDSETSFVIPSSKITSYTIGTTANLPEVQKENHNFTGWFIDEECQNEINSITSTMHGNLNLYPKFDIISHTINYHNVGNGSHSNPTTYNNTTGAITLANATKQDYEFKGWYDNATFTGNKITIIPAGSTGTINLYAKFICTKVDDEGYSLITSEMDFIERVGADYTGKYRLTNSLDFTGYDYVPIGSHSVPFRGELDGNNKLITGIEFDSIDRYCGLFGYMLGAKIYNLNLSYFNFEFDVEQNYTKQCIGALAGRADNCKIEDVEVSYVKILVFAPYSSVGSLVGYAHGNTEIISCELDQYASNVSDIQVWGNTIKVGGLCGELTTGASINKCFANYNGTGGVFVGTGNDLSMDMKLYCGGLVGYSNLGHISNSYVKQSKDSDVTLNLYSTPYYATSESAVGGIVGYMEQNSSLENCYGVINEVVGAYSTGNAQYSIKMSVGGLVGEMNNVLAIKNLFIIAPNDGGYRRLTMYNDVIFDCGYIVGNKLAEDELINCYAEKDMTTNRNASEIYDLNLVDKTKTYNEFKTLLGWSHDIWYFSQSSYALPSLK